MRAIVVVGIGYVLAAGVAARQALDVGAFEGQSFTSVWATMVASPVEVWRTLGRGFPPVGAKP